MPTTPRGAGEAACAGAQAMEAMQETSATDIARRRGDAEIGLLRMMELPFGSGAPLAGTPDSTHRQREGMAGFRHGGISSLRRSGAAEC
jgi:hypothetical protein